VDFLQLNGNMKDIKKRKDACRNPSKGSSGKNNISQFNNIPVFFISNAESTKSFIDGIELYFPCGRIANSMFRDTIGLSYIENPKSVPVTEKVVQLKKLGIAWSSDKKVRYENPKSPWNATVRDSYSIQGNKLAKPKCEIVESI
jgi:hypothetical protein